MGGRALHEKGVRNGNRSRVGSNQEQTPLRGTTELGVRVEEVRYESSKGSDWGQLQGAVMVGQLQGGADESLHHDAHTPGGMTVGQG